MKISKIKAIELLDSRGNPTVGACVSLEDGSEGYSIVPSGASTGENEAVELRDNDLKRFFGKGVQKAVQNVNTKINDALVGQDVFDQTNIDQIMIKMDGTENKSNLGANAILSVSLSVAKAAANSKGIPLYQYVNNGKGHIMPMPMVNIINGGAHADNSIDFQEFMIMPTQAQSFSEAIRKSVEVFMSLKNILKKDGHSTSVGDEGGFAPNLRSAEEAIEYIIKAIDHAGYIPGKDVSIALDPASSELFENGSYNFKRAGKIKNIDEQVEYLMQLINSYPILSIEDGMAENDFLGWEKLTQKAKSKCQLVGDDLFVTNTKYFSEGIKRQIGNSILVKVNQIGTLTELYATVDMAVQSNYSVVMSHRSGETEDTTIADLAVALNCGLIKTGSMSRSDRTSKYNRLLQIEHELASKAIYKGHQSLNIG